MIDFHTHILPGIDDGSRSVEHSIQMLSLYPEEVTGICLTPHFYPSEDKPEEMLARRQKAYEELLEGTKDIKHPPFYLGCEVHYFRGMSKFNDITKFALEGTNLILVEMPMSHWSINMMDDVLNLKKEFGLQPVLAHIDRYKFAKGDNEEAFHHFINNGGLVQMNFEAFTGFFSKRTALKLLKNHTVQFLGTDTHNTSSRKPDMEEGLSKLSAKDRQEVTNLIMRNEAKYFG